MTTELYHRRNQLRLVNVGINAGITATHSSTIFPAPAEFCQLSTLNNGIQNLTDSRALQLGMFSIHPFPKQWMLKEPLSIVLLMLCVCVPLFHPRINGTKPLFNLGAIFLFSHMLILLYLGFYGAHSCVNGLDHNGNSINVLENFLRESPKSGYLLPRRPFNEVMDTHN